MTATDRGLKPYVEVRHNDDGTIDEVVLYDALGRCLFHLEQLDRDLWYFGLYPTVDPDDEVQFDIVRRKKRVDVVEQDVGIG